MIMNLFSWGMTSFPNKMQSARSLGRPFYTERFVSLPPIGQAAQEVVRPNENRIGLTFRNAGAGDVLLAGGPGVVTRDNGIMLSSLDTYNPGSLPFTVTGGVWAVGDNGHDLIITSVLR